MPPRLACDDPQGTGSVACLTEEQGQHDDQNAATPGSAADRAHRF
jgi:hypothetical protein